MRLLYFLIFSSIESAAAFILILSLFRFQIRGYIAQIAFCSFILAQLSYLLNDVLHYEAIAPILQLFLYILFLWLMFRVQIFYAAIMSVMGYLLYALLQTVIIFILESLNIFTLDQAIKVKALGYLLQVITSIITIVICWLLNRNRIGFSFVPDNSREHILLRGRNIRFLIIMFFAALVISVVYIFALSGISHIIINAIFLAIILLLLVQVSMKKEGEDD